MADAIHIVGGGLAGVEAAWALAKAQVPVVLHEMRPERMTEAHRTGGLAELVCSNSFRSDTIENAVGLLHAEMRRAGSLVMAIAERCKVPAGSALAVDREAFSRGVTEAIAAEPLIVVRREEVTALDGPGWGPTLVATGPLTSPKLSAVIQGLTKEERLAFFDAIAPIVARDSIDFEIAWFQSRYDKSGPGGGGADYINCPLDRDGYQRFVEALLEGKTADFKEWEKSTPYFEGCLPIEVMAARGRDTLRFGPMKPVGLRDPRTQKRPFAVVQLRQDNRLGTLFNMVGFQTKLKHAEQTRIFRTIPGLAEARFERLGGIHRNTFLNSPRLLDERLRLKSEPRIRFAGQITGVEGYVESAATGLLAGRFLAAERLGSTCDAPPRTTAMGALLNHITSGADPENFQPMNVNFGLFPPLDPQLPAKAGAAERKAAHSRRALEAIDHWLGARAAAE